MELMGQYRVSEWPGRALYRPLGRFADTDGEIVAYAAVSRIEALKPVLGNGCITDQ